MGGKGKGGSTSFEGMSHEQMLQWLDQANTGMVQAAADRLAAAAKEIHKIAEELKVRPQWVAWKGQGADAFRTWSGDLANATLRLADFSEGSSKWLGHASDAIASAQASIPRDKKSAQANLDAAHGAHGDPDAGAVAAKSSSELAAIAADKEKVRQEAAAQMRKLGQAYSLSATQMDGLERPTFPPPPKAIGPGADRDERSSDVARPGATSGGTAASTGIVGAAPATHGHAASTVRPGTGPSVAAPSPEPVHSVEPGPAHRVDAEPPTRMDVDSVGTLPEAPHAPAHATGGAPGGPPAGGPGGHMTPSTGTNPPVFGGPGGTAFGGRGGGTAFGGRGSGGPIGGRGAAPIGSGGGTVRPGGPSATGGVGRTSSSMRGPMMPGQSATGTGRAGTGSLPGRLPSSGGVAGGRPQQATGRPATGIPRGTVMGGEDAAGRGPMGQGATGARPGSTGSGQRGTTSGRRMAGENGGIVGGRPQQQGRANARSFSSGGSGLVRGQGPGRATPEGTRGEGQAGRSGATPNDSHPVSRRDEERGGTPDHLTEDEETRQPNARRNVPPVVD